MNADLQKRLNRGCWFQFIFQTILFGGGWITYLKVFDAASWNKVSDNLGWIIFASIILPLSYKLRFGIRDINYGGDIPKSEDFYDVHFQKYKADKKKIFTIILLITSICCLLFAIAIFFTKKYRPEISWNDFYICVIYSFLLGIEYYLLKGLYPLFPKEREKIREAGTFLDK